MAGQVPSVEPSSTRINSNVIPVASRTSVIARCADVAGFVHRRNDHAQPRPVASLSLTASPAGRCPLRPTAPAPVHHVVRDLSRGLLFQGNHVPDRHSLQLCGLCAPSGTHTKTVAVRVKFRRGVRVRRGRDQGIVGLVRLSQRPVERSTQRPLAGPTARQLVRVSLLALPVDLGNCGGEPFGAARRFVSADCDQHPASCRRNASGHPDGAADRRHCLGDRDRSSNQCADRSRLQLPSGRSPHCRRVALTACLRLTDLEVPGSTTTPLSTRSRPS